METTFINKSLRQGISEMLENKSNISKVYKSSVSGNSIEVVYSEPIVYVSYTYYEDVASRDSDMEKLEKLIVL
jgi:hypothetical protein